MYLFGGLQWIMSSGYFFMIKRENNAVPKFFKMFSIVQMMFIKEVNLIQWEFSIIRFRFERRNPVAQFIRPFVLLEDIL